MSKIGTLIERACRLLTDRLVKESVGAPQNRGVDPVQCERQAKAVEQVLAQGPCQSNPTDAEQLAQCLYREHKDAVAALLSPPFGEAIAAAAREGRGAGADSSHIKLANAYWHYLRERDAVSWQTLQTAAQGAPSQQSTTVALSFMARAIRYRAAPLDPGIAELLNTPFMRSSSAEDQIYQEYLFDHLFRRDGSGAAVFAWLGRHPRQAPAVRGVLMTVATETTNGMVRTEAKIALEGPPPPTPAVP